MKDITGWISGNPYVRVTGLSEWTALSVTDAEARGSDLSGEGDVGVRRFLTCGPPCLRYGCRHVEDDR